METQNKTEKILDVVVQCLATYHSKVKVQPDMSLEEAVKHAKKNINKIPVGELSWVSDSDIIDELR